MLNQPCNSRINPNWSWCIILLILVHGQIWFANMIWSQEIGFFFLFNLSPVLVSGLKKSELNQVIFNTLVILHNVAVLHFFNNSPAGKTLQVLPLSQSNIRTHALLLKEISKCNIFYSKVFLMFVAIFRSHFKKFITFCAITSNIILYTLPRLIIIIILKDLNCQFYAFFLFSDYYFLLDNFKEIFIYQGY